MSSSIPGAAHHVQDRGPAGGYPEIRYERNLPKRGPGGRVFWLVGTLTFLGGFWVVAKGNQERRELRREMVETRRNVAPFLQAEQDLKVLHRD